MLGNKLNGDGKNMTKYDYENILEKIKILEIKTQRLTLEKIHLKQNIPSVLRYKKRKKWLIQYNHLINEEEITSLNLYKSYAELEKFLKK